MLERNHRPEHSLEPNVYQQQTAKASSTLELEILFSLLHGSANSLSKRNSILL